MIAPPKLLTGAAWILWGAVLGVPLVGLLCALAVEIAMVRPRLRFEFGERAYVSAWRLGLFAFLATAGVSYLLGSRVLVIYSLLRWLPLYFLPVDLLMRYGARATIPANTFAYFARRKMLQDRRLGVKVRPLQCHTGYASIALLLVCASQAAEPKDRWLLLIGVLAILVASLVFLTRKRHRLLPLFIVVASVAAASYYGAEGLHHTVRKLTQQNGEAGTAQNSGEEVRTQIGELGELKLSQEVLWRAEFGSGKRLRLLSQAMFNQYSYGRWQHRAPPTDEGYRQSVNDDYSSAVIAPDSKLFVFDYQREDIRISTAGLASVTVQGRVDTTTALPMPPRPVAIDGIARSDEEITALAIEGFLLEANSLGTVRSVNPPGNALRYTVHYGRDDRVELAPWQQDLHVPREMRATIDRFIDSFGLRKLSPREQIIALRRHFTTEFRYTTHLVSPAPRFSRHRANPLATFLEQDKAGHCEYFATATTLILRRLGIPARYCIGYAVVEKSRDSDTWLMRGTHAHAWVRAYDGGEKSRGEWSGGEWKNVDLTPSSWLAADTAVAKPRNALLEWFQRQSEAFTLWQFRAANDGSLVLIIGGGILLLLVYALIRMRGVRRAKVQETAPLTATIDPDREGLTPLMPLLEKAFGSRPLSASIHQWLQPFYDKMPSLQKAVQLHQRLRYDPAPPTTTTQAEMKRLRRQLSKESPAQRPASETEKRSANP